MFLCELIERLERAPQDHVCPLGFDHPHSYRGTYSELAFEPTRDCAVASMLACAREALGRTYHGYKGGEYPMDAYSLVYLATHGTCGAELSALLLEYMLGGDPWAVL